jgi:hypothetical protein
MDEKQRREETPSINNLTGLVVSYNQDCVITAIESIRRFYPELPLIIVDGSTEKKVREFFDNLDNCQTVYVDFNISHGRGLHLGITISPTEYVLCFDTDIEMIEPCVEKMLELFKLDTLMVGKTVKLAQKSHGVDLHDGSDFTYIYPHFHIINRYNYRKYYPYIHSGAPGQILLPQIKELGLERVLKPFPVDDNVKHNQGGTSQLVDPQLNNGNTLRSHAENWIIQTEFFDKCKT